MTRLSFALVLLALASARAAEPLKLTLTDAVRLALSQNRALKIARLKIAENEHKKAIARSSYYPEIKNQSAIARTTAEQNIEIPAGALAASAAGLVPSRNILIDQGNQTFVTSGTMATQPLTPLIRIHQANRIAASVVAASRDSLKNAENEVALKVHEVYYGILIALLQKKAAEQEVAYSRILARETEEDVRTGSALSVAVLETQAGLLDTEQTLLTVGLRIADLNTELNDLLGLPLSTPLELSSPEPASLTEVPRADALRSALAQNPEIATAMESVRQARAAVTAAKSAYIPDVAVFARHSYQNGVPFLVHNFGTFGVALSYDVFEFGKRRSTVREREAQLAQAEENVERVKEAVGVQIERSLNKVKQTNHLLQVAAEVVRLRAERERIAENQLTSGVVLVSARRQASAAVYKAQASMLQAELAHRLANAALDAAIGNTPGQ